MCLLWVYAFGYVSVGMDTYVSLSVWVHQCPYRPLCMNGTCILSRRQAYQHTQDVRFSLVGSGTGRTCAKEDAYGGLRWRLEEAKACTLSAHRWAAGSSGGGGHGQGSPACDCPPARGRTWAAGAWLLRAVASAAVAALSAPRRGRAFVSPGAGGGERGRVWGSDP